MFARGLLARFDHLRPFSPISECPWPLVTVEYSLCDGDRALVRRNRLKIDLCGFRNGFDRNLRIISWYPVVVGLQQLQIVILISINHFLDPVGVGGLYVRAKGISHTMSPKTSRLWDIWSHFDLIFASEVLRVITQRHVREGSSHSIWSPQIVFTDFWVSVTLNNCRIQSLRRR